MGVLSPTRAEDLRKQLGEAAAERAALDEQLTQLNDRLAAEASAKSVTNEKMETTQREIEIMRVELTAARQNLEKAEWEKNKVCAHSRQHEQAVESLCERI